MIKVIDYTNGEEVTTIDSVYNLEEFLDHHMRKNIIMAEFYLEDGRIHDDVNYHYYQVIEVRYKNQHCDIIVRPFPKYENKIAEKMKSKR